MLGRAVNDEPPDGAVTRADDKTASANPGARQVQLDKGAAAEPRLGRGVEDHRIGDDRKLRQQANRVHTGAWVDVEANVVHPRIRVGIQDRLP